MGHTYTHLLVHLVFSTKRRACSITLEIEEDLYAYMGGIVREMGGKPSIINGAADHMHLLVLLPPTVALADLVRVVKANSSRWVHEKWPGHKGFGWQGG